MSALISLLVIIAAFGFVFSIVVIIHELGHFWVARLCRVKVEAYSVGFGKTIFSRTDKHGTQWKLSALPLGGYVKFWGDANAASAPDRAELARMRAQMEAEHGADVAAQCYHFKPVWQRMAIVAAGPLANFILAIALFAGLALTLGETQLRPLIDSVVEGSAAEAAGIRAGDEVVSVDGDAIRYFSDLQQAVMLRRGDSISIGVDRDGELIDLTAVLETRYIQDDFGNDVPIGGLGVRVAGTEDTIIRVRHNPLSAIGSGIDRTGAVITGTARYISRVVTGRENADQIGSIIRIGAVSGKVAERAYSAPGEQAALSDRLLNVLISLLSLTALLSVSLGMINLLPIPMLDGGHLAFYTYEAIAQRPLAPQAQEWGLRIGLALILSFMIFATLNDLRYLRVFDALGNLFS